MAATAFSPRLSRARSASPSYLWEVPGKPVIVHVALEVLDRLDREVAESFRSLEAPGAEIGGLLLGTVQGASPVEVFIQSYEVVPSEYKRGPLYKLSPRDLELFEAVLAQRVGAAKQVVGFFRSHTRKGLGLDTEDVAIFNKFFPKQYQVALLAKPFATKLTAGAVFIREGWSLRSESSYKEFHFRTSTVERRRASVASLKGGERPSPAPASNPRAGQPPAVGRTTVIPIESRGGVIVPPLRGPGLEAAGPVPSAAEPGTAAHEPVEQHPETWTGWAPPMVVPVEHGALPAGDAHQKRKSLGLIWIALSARLMGIVKAVKPICIVPSAMLLATLRAVRPICINASGKLAAAVSAARPMWIAGASVAALVVLSGLLFFPGLHRTKRPATTTSKNTSTLSFRVERSAGELLLTWNRDADVIHEATHAVLAIADGERHQSVNLDQAQLRDGGIVYMPSNSDIKFQLAVTGRKPSQTQSEFLRVLRVSPWATPEPPAASPKPVSKRTRAAKAPALRSSKASEGPGAELAKAQNEAAPLADDLIHSSGSGSALDLPDAPTLTLSPQAQAVLFPGNMAALTATLVSQSQVPAPAPPDILEPRVGEHASEAQILTQTPPEYPLAPKQARVQGSVVVRALSAVTATLNQRRHCRVLRSCGTQKTRFVETTPSVEGPGAKISESGARHPSSE